MIDYGVIHDSLAYYEARGYKRVELPWLVTDEISQITRPHFADTYWVTRDHNNSRKVFVASAEQAFLYQIIKGTLPVSGKFQSVTPCMRSEGQDLLHRKYFIKNELIWYGSTKDFNAHKAAWEKNLQTMIRDANMFFRLKVADVKLLNTRRMDVETHAYNYDIEYAGIELGSYGIRTFENVTWIYGTGVAEPRFSTVKERTDDGVSYTQDSEGPLWGSEQDS